MPLNDNFETQVHKKPIQLLYLTLKSMLIKRAFGEHINKEDGECIMGSVLYFGEHVFPLHLKAYQTMDTFHYHKSSFKGICRPHQCHSEHW